MIRLGWSNLRNLLRDSIQTGAPIYAADTAANDTYVVTLDPAPQAYTTGMLINFLVTTANTGAATLNVNSLGAKNILKNHDQALATGDIEASQLVTVVYDGTQFQMQSQSGQGIESTDVATETSVGVVELATDAETVTGSSDAVVATPGNITARLAAPGAIGGTTPAAGYFVGQVTSHGATEAATAATMYGNMHLVTGAYVVTLPPAVLGMHATFMATTAAAFSVDSDTSGTADAIILSGTELDSGDKITSDASQYATVFLECVVADHWMATPTLGLFIDGGA